MTSNRCMTMTRPRYALGSEVDRMLGLFNTAFAPPASDGREVNVGQDSQNCYVEFVVPGTDPASLELTVEDGVLRIVGQHKAAAGEDNVVRWTQRERPEGKFTRRLRLPELVNADAIQAEYRDGILLVTIPKAEAAKPRKIHVEVN